MLAQVRAVEQVPVGAQALVVVQVQVVALEPDLVVERVQVVAQVPAVVVAREQVLVAVQVLAAERGTAVEQVPVSVHDNDVYDDDRNNNHRYKNINSELVHIQHTHQVQNSRLRPLYRHSNW